MAVPVLAMDSADQGCDLWTEFPAWLQNCLVTVHLPSDHRAVPDPGYPHWDRSWPVSCLPGFTLCLSHHHELAWASELTVEHPWTCPAHLVQMLWDGALADEAPLLLAAFSLLAPHSLESHWLLLLPSSCSINPGKKELPVESMCVRVWVCRERLPMKSSWNAEFCVPVKWVAGSWIKVGRKGQTLQKAVILPEKGKDIKLQEGETVSNEEG